MSCTQTHNILILDNELGMGGVEKKLYDFVTRVDRKHFRLVVCCLKQGGYFRDKFVEQGVTFYEDLLSNKYDVSAYWKLLGIIERENIDLIYTFAHPNTMVFATLARFTRKVPALVVSFHATGSPDGGLLLKPWQRPLLRSADRVLAVAEIHRKYLQETERVDADITVIHNGVDIARYRPGDVSDEFKRDIGVEAGDVVVTTIASLNRRKRINNLLDVAATVLPSFPRTKFLIVGGGPEEEALKAQASQLGIADRVRFTGVRDDVDDVLRVSDVFVLPSALGTETFPNVVLEAMSSGVPVVTTDVGSVAELITSNENGIVVPPTDVEALAGGITKLLSDSELRGTYSTRSRQIVEEKFTIDGMCRKREDLFSGLLCQRSDK